MKWLKGLVVGSLVSCALIGSVMAESTIRNGPSGNSKEATVALALQDQLNTNGKWNVEEFKIVNLAPDATTFSVGTGSVFYTGSNTAATAITDVTSGTVGQIFTIVTTGGGNWSTIADSGNFNCAGQGGFVPNSADDSISFLIQADNDYIQLYGTMTDN